MTACPGASTRDYRSARRSTRVSRVSVARQFASRSAPRREKRQRPFVSDRTKVEDQIDIVWDDAQQRQHTVDRVRNWRISIVKILARPMNASARDAPLTRKHSVIP